MKFPVGARVRCCDPNHRDHQHHQGVGSIRGVQQEFRLGMVKTDAPVYEVAWANVTHIQEHAGETLYRVFSRDEWAEMRRQLLKELDKVRREI